MARKNENCCCFYVWTSTTSASLFFLKVTTTALRAFPCSAPTPSSPRSTGESSSPCHSSPSWRYVDECVCVATAETQAVNYLLVLLPTLKSLSFGKRNMCLCRGISLFIFFVHPCRTRSAPCAPGTPPCTTRSASIGSPPVSVTLKRRIGTANANAEVEYFCVGRGLCAFPLVSVLHLVQMASLL